MNHSPDAGVGVGILGATGYSGAELLRLLSAHPHVQIRAVGSRQQVGVPVGQVLPGLPHLHLRLVDEQQPATAWRDSGVEVLFAALPHGVIASRAAEFLSAGIRLIDLSSDFRLRVETDYQTHYHVIHPAPQLLGQAIYGLTEWVTAGALQKTQLVANPGCYATAILLALLPAVAQAWVSDAPVVVTAMSGVSGAGRAVKLATHFGECGNNVSPYSVGESHAHLGEMRQAWRSISGAPTAPQLVFNPHLVPMARGISATVAIPLAAPLSVETVRAHYSQRYATHAFVNLLPADALPETRHVRGSNRCDMAVRVVADGRMLLVFSAIDNLLKGAAGQAVQNLNCMYGWPETTALSLGGWSCA